MTDTRAVELRSGALRLALRPDLGGSVAGLWLDQLPVLRSTDAAALAGPRQSGAFPLVPYSNRLGYRRFRWQGHDYTVAANFDDHPHALHGCGWLQPWQVAASDDASARLLLRHEPDAHWPFAFEAEQRFSLTPTTLRLELRATNRDARRQPMGLGWHPYFPRRSRSRLHAEVTDRWESDGTHLPTRRVAQAGLDGDLAFMDFDHGFEGFSGSARLRDEKLSLRLSSSMTRLVVFTPRERDYFCVEPVSHVTNAIHMADPASHGLPAVEPGASIEAWIELEATPV